MHWICITTWILVVYLCSTTVTYKILVYNPQVWYSHVQYWGSIADTLTKAGHNVTVFVPRFFDNINSTGTKLSKTLIRPRTFSLPYTIDYFVSGAFRKRSDSPSRMIRVLEFLHSSQAFLCNDQMADKNLLNNLIAEKFDLGITEVYSTCGFALFHKIGLNAYVTGFSTNMPEFTTIPFGIDNNPSYVPGTLSALSDEMTYLERVQNVLIMLAERILSFYYLPVEEYYASLIPGFDLRAAVSKSAFVFVNTDEFIEFPRPINHKIIFVGGIAVAEPKPLSPELNKLIANATNDVVFVSFGTMANLTDAVDSILDAFVILFENLPKVTFIWKYEGTDDLATNLTNVIKRSWLPQNDLLNHPKVKAFISHCGMNSMMEGAKAGKPFVCIPLFVEQGRNAKMVEKRGIGRIISKQCLTGDLLTETVRAVLYQPRYRRTAERLSDIIRNKPFSVTERVIKYVEFAAKFQGAENLQPSCVQLTYLQYYLLDIIIPAIILITLSTFCFVTVTVRLLQNLFRCKAKLE